MCGMWYIVHMYHPTFLCCHSRTPPRTPRMLLHLLPCASVYILLHDIIVLTDQVYGVIGLVVRVQCTFKTFRKRLSYYPSHSTARRSKAYGTSKATSLGSLCERHCPTDPTWPTLFQQTSVTQPSSPTPLVGESTVESTPFFYSPTVCSSLL